DGNGESRADRLAQLAGDAALLAVRVAAQRVFAAKPRAQRPLLEGIVDGRLGREEIAERQPHGLEELRQKDGSRRLGHSHRVITTDRSTPGPRIAARQLEMPAE